MARFTLANAAALLVALLLVVSGASAAGSEGTTSFYGMLDLPAAYFQHPDSEDAINRIQPGSVLLHNSHTSIVVPVQKGGAFTVYHLPYGSYLLQAEFHDFTFPTVRVEVQYKERAATAEDGAAADKKVRVPVIRVTSNDFPVKPLRGSGVDEQSPAMVPPTSVHEYYVPRAQFRATDLLKNPMILMMVISFGLMGVMKLFPEEDMKESQKMSKEWQQKLFNKATGAIDGAAVTAGSDKKKN